MPRVELCLCAPQIHIRLCAKLGLCQHLPPLKLEFCPPQSFVLREVKLEFSRLQTLGQDFASSGANSALGELHFRSRARISLHRLSTRKSAFLWVDVDDKGDLPRAPPPRRARQYASLAAAPHLKKMLVGDSSCGALEPSAMRSPCRIRAIHIDDSCQQLLRCWKLPHTRSIQLLLQEA